LKQITAAFIVGLLFGLGLIQSEMVNPARVLGFLDISRQWDPTLVFVMAGALLVTALGYRIVLSYEKPWLEAGFSVPSNRVIDARLLVGAALFGIGWGLVGLCPGPALVGLATLNTDIAIFVVAMIAGMKAFDYLAHRI